MVSVPGSAHGVDFGGVVLGWVLQTNHNMNLWTVTISTRKQSMFKSASWSILGIIATSCLPRDRVKFFVVLMLPCRVNALESLIFYPVNRQHTQAVHRKHKRTRNRKKAVEASVITQIMTKDFSNLKFIRSLVLDEVEQCLWLLTE